MTVKNTGKFAVGVVDVDFLIPSCLGGNPSDNMQMMAQTVGLGYDSYSGTLSFTINALAPAASRSVTINLFQLTSGVCRPRQVLARVSGDYSTQVSAAQLK